MHAVTTNLLFALLLPAAPAPVLIVADKVPADLIDLIPDDSAAVLVLNVKAAKTSKIAPDLIKLLTVLDEDNEFPLAELIASAETIVLAQFAIVTGVGDYAMIVRLNDGETFTKALAKSAKGDRNQPVTQKIGKHEVVRLFDDDEATFARIDARTVMMVVANGSKDQIRDTLAQAYGERKVRGPHAELRKLVETIKLTEHLTIVGKHAKVGHAFVWPTILIGHDVDQSTGLNDKLEFFRCTSHFGDDLRVAVQATTQNEAAAKIVAASLKSPNAKDKDVPITPKIDVDGSTVTLHYALTKETLATWIKREAKNGKK